MPDQYIFVNFPETRTVLSGGKKVGPTNQDLTINGGTHTFTLSDPQDYDPPSQKLFVGRTTVVTPMQIDFTQLPPPPPPPAPPVAPV